jgi:hypothetical protein
MGSLCSFGTCTSTYDGFDARQWEGWDGWIRNLALHPSPDQKQNKNSTAEREIERGLKLMMMAWLFSFSSFCVKL